MGNYGRVDSLDRIVSITQPHIRPIVRGKAGKPVEFGAKLADKSSLLSLSDEQLLENVIH
jgi:hypothetical protein